MPSSRSMSTPARRAPSHITRDAIRAARDEFERRAREAETTDEGVSFDNIVVAHNVTPEQLANVPDAWLDGVRVALRADGPLVITKLDTLQHKAACAELFRQAGNCTAAGGGNGQILRAASEASIRLSAGEVIQPDVQICYRSADRANRRIPLVLLEVEVHHRYMPEIIRTAALYLRELPTAQRVVFLKYYPCRPSDQPGRLNVPAIVIVFRRAQAQAVAGRIEVVEVRSFGNATIDPRVTNKLASPDPNGPLEPFADASNHREPAAWQRAILHGG